MKPLLALFCGLCLVAGILLVRSKDGHDALAQGTSAADPALEPRAHAALTRTPGSKAETESPSEQGLPTAPPVASRAPVSVAVETPAEAPRELHIFGTVVSEDHRPIPYAEIILFIEGTRIRPETLGEIRSGYYFRSRGSEEAGDILKTVLADDLGAFDMGHLPSADLENAKLCFALGSFAGTPPTQDLILDGREQYLKLPAPPIAGLELRLEAPEGTLAEPFPEWAALDLIQLGEGVPGGRRKASAQHITLSSGRLVARGLSPGTWCVLVRCAGYAPATVDVEVAAGPELTSSTLKLTAPTQLTGHYAEHRPHFEANEPWQDPALGSDSIEVAGQSPRKFREPGMDKWFAHTLRGFGQGTVRSAYLELELKGRNGLGSNDGLHLEFKGWDARPRWLYGVYLKDLVPAGTLGQNRHHRVLLDLGAMPHKDGNVNLLSELEDGKLDVYVEDDTVVLDVALHIHR